MRPSKDITNLANRLINDKWMILPSTHRLLLDTVQRFLENPVLPDVPEDGPPQAATVEDEDQPLIAVVEVSGVLMKHASLVDQLFGATDLDSIRYALKDAMEDDTINTIVMWFNSPGGVTTGIEELGRYIAECGTKKRIIAFTDTVCASAALWLASACSEIVMTPTAEIGSVGVFSLVLNDEEALRQAGIRLEAFSSGKYKLMGHSFRTLTDEEREILQKEVNEQHEIFKNTIKSHRPEISDGDMEGLMYSGLTAVEKHFADYTVDAIDDLLDQIGEHMKIETNKASVDATVPKNETLAQAPEAAIPGVPGVNESEPDLEDKDRDAKEDGQEFDKDREKYQADEPENKDEERAEDNPEDYVECVCDKCGAKYKVKKSEVEDEEKSEEEEPEDEEKAEATEDEEKDKEGMRAEFAPTLSNWKHAIANLKLNPGTLQMREPDHNLKAWRDAQDQFRNQKD